MIDLSVQLLLFDIVITKSVAAQPKIYRSRNIIKAVVLGKANKTTNKDIPPRVCKVDEVLIKVKAYENRKYLFYRYKYSFVTIAKEIRLDYVIDVKELIL